MELLLRLQVRDHPGCELTVRRGRLALAPEDAAGGRRGTSIRTGGCGQARAQCAATRPAGSGLRGADGAFRAGFAKSRMVPGRCRQDGFPMGSIMHHGLALEELSGEARN